MFGKKVLEFRGSALQSETERIFPVGLCKVVVHTSPIAVAFVDPQSTEVVTMFALNVGQHNVNCPSHVLVAVEADEDAKWTVISRGRFNIYDPNRDSIPLVRPLTPQQEMQSYANDLVTRALAAQYRSDASQGLVEFDFERETYEEDEESDFDLSVHQLNELERILQQDIAAAKLRSASPPSQSTAAPAVVGTPPPEQTAS